MHTTENIKSRYRISDEMKSIIENLESLNEEINKIEELTEYFYGPFLDEEVSETEFPDSVSDKMMHVSAAISNARKRLSVCHSIFLAPE